MSEDEETTYCDGSKLVISHEVIKDTCSLAPGTYVLRTETYGWVPCDKNGSTRPYCVCAKGLTPPISKRTFTVTGKNATMTVFGETSYCDTTGCNGDYVDCLGENEGGIIVTPGGTDIPLDPTLGSSTL